MDSIKLQLANELDRKKIFLQRRLDCLKSIQDRGLSKVHFESDRNTMTTDIPEVAKNTHEMSEALLGKMMLTMIGTLYRLQLEEVTKELEAL